MRSFLTQSNFNEISNWQRRTIRFFLTQSNFNQFFLKLATPCHAVFLNAIPFQSFFFKLATPCHAALLNAIEFQWRLIFTSISVSYWCKKRSILLIGPISTLAESLGWPIFYKKITIRRKWFYKSRMKSSSK